MEWFYVSNIVVNPSVLKNGDFDAKEYWRKSTNKKQLSKILTWKNFAELSILICMYCSLCHYS